MIVDLFGPPCSGKTVFAMALAARLRQVGLDVRLHVSSRGDETVAPYADSRLRWLSVATLNRLWRPALELASEAARSVDRQDIATDIRPLLQLAGNRSIVKTLRFRRYVRKLARLWHDAKTSAEVTIFDQGYVQAIGSALLLHPSASEPDVARVFLSLPQADLLIRVEAPADVIEERLRRRLQSLDAVARLLETTMGITESRIRDHMAAIDKLSALLARCGNPVRVVRSDDAASLEACVAEIAARNGRAADRPRARLTIVTGDKDETSGNPAFCCLQPR